MGDSRALSLSAKDAKDMPLAIAAAAASIGLA